VQPQRTQVASLDGGGARVIERLHGGRLVEVGVGVGVEGRGWGGVLGLKVEGRVREMTKAEVGGGIEG